MSSEFFYKYVNDNNLEEVNEGMHSFYKNSDGKIIACRIHGFVKDEFFIKDINDNFNILQFINKKI